MTDEKTAPRAAAARKPRVSRHMEVAVAALCVAIYGIHNVGNVIIEQPENFLWSCHISILLVGMAYAFRSPLLNAMGFFWILMGVPLWIIDLCTGGWSLLTSTLTHLGSLFLGGFGIAHFGMPRGAWRKAIAVFMLLQLVTRLITPAKTNVNVAHAVWTGWEKHFPSYFWYMVMLYSIAAVGFLSVEIVMRKVSPVVEEAAP